MHIWIQSLSWTLIYALGQGLLVYGSLRLIFKLAPGTPSATRYYLSLSALAILLAWFAGTWWSQYHSTLLSAEQLKLTATGVTAFIMLPTNGTVDYVTRFRAGMESVRVIFPWLSGAYLLGLGFMVLRLFAGMRQLFALKANGTAAPDAMLNELLESLKKKMQWNAPVKLLISARASVPMVVGFLKPIILLPVATAAQLSTAQIETILLHELAHLKRYDYLVNILQTVVETILFFNPFVWLVSGICRREREYSCDDMVLQYTTEPISYATALTALASPDFTYSSVVVAATGEPTHLFNRIKRIMEMKKRTFSYSRTSAAVLIIAIIACLAAWLPSSVARPKDDKPTKVKPEKVAEAQKAPDATASQDAMDSQSEEGRLVQLLINDGLVNQIKGFVVEKKQSSLFINGEKQAEEVSKKYLSTMTQENMRVQVSSFSERLNMHPDASFLQILLPVSLESPCVDVKSKRKPGC